jgi:glutaredoxin-like protein
MALIGEEDRKYLSEQFKKDLKNKVKIIVFTEDSSDCKYCNETLEITKELGQLSDMISIENYKINDAKAKEFNVEFAPTTIITDEEETMSGRIRYTGIPAGYEFSSLIEDMISVSSGKLELNAHVLEHLDEVDKPIKIMVFVTPTCPYCPKAVRVAHKFAQYNKNITGEMVESIEFPDRADKYGVQSVPHIVINENVQFIGAYPEESFVEYVMEAYNKYKD